MGATYIHTTIEERIPCDLVDGTLTPLPVSGKRLRGPSVYVTQMIFYLFNFCITTDKGQLSLLSPTHTKNPDFTES